MQFLSHFTTYHYIGYNTRSAPRPGNDSWAYGGKMGWNPSRHNDPFKFKFPFNTMSIAMISPDSARFSFRDWKKVSIHGVEAWKLTGKCN